MKTKRTITLEDNTTVEISDESYAALVDAAREPVGEELVRGLQIGTYCINNWVLRIEYTPRGNKGFYREKQNCCFSHIGCGDDTWRFRFKVETYIGMKIADLRQHHIKPYTVEWRDMTREEVLAFLAHYREGVVCRLNQSSWNGTRYYAFEALIADYSFATIARCGEIGEAHKFRCTVDAPHKVEGTGYEF